MYIKANLIEILAKESIKLWGSMIFKPFGLPVPVDSGVHLFLSCFTVAYWFLYILSVNHIWVINHS